MERAANAMRLTKATFRLSTTKSMHSFLCNTVEGRSIDDMYDYEDQKSQLNCVRIGGKYPCGTKVPIISALLSSTEHSTGLRTRNSMAGTLFIPIHIYYLFIYFVLWT